MASTKAGGTTKNLNDSNPKYLGVKRHDGEKVTPGEVVVRQRGTLVLPGKNLGVGKDHTLFALKNGIVKFSMTRKTDFDGRWKKRNIVHVVAA